MTEPPKEETPFEKFQRLAKRIVAVPKKEADAVAKREKAKKAAEASP
jgi:ribosomal protein S7